MVSQKYRWDFIGLSTDDKPTSETSDKVVNGSTYYCSDTSKLYVYCDGTWYERKPLGGGGGGGTTYTAGDGIDITNEVISATNTGKAKVLTTADYNWPTDNPDGVAIWLLDPGAYHCEGVKTYINSNYSDTNTHSFIVSKSGGITYVLHLMYNGDKIWWQYFNGNSQSDSSFVLSKKDVINGLNSTATDSPLSARQGKVLKDLIGDLTNLTTTDKTNLVAAINEAAASGGGGPTVVQTTGTSTTDVMSQNAVTSMVFADPSTKYRVQIGDNTRSSADHSVAIGSSHSSQWMTNASGNRAVAIGLGSNATANYSVALGSFSEASEKGQFDISTSRNPGSTLGYNNSAYRLLTGLYDPQSAHDAATKGYVDGLTTMGILSATPTGTTTGVPGRLYTYDTGGGSYEVYLCVHDNGDNTYVWKQVSLI